LVRNHLTLQGTSVSKTTLTQNGTLTLDHLLPAPETVEISSFQRRLFGFFSKPLLLRGTHISRLHWSPLRNKTDAIPMIILDTYI